MKPGQIMKLVFDAILQLFTMIETGAIAPEEAERRVKAGIAAFKGRHAEAKKWLGLG